MIEKIKENWDKILLTLKEEHEISNISYSTWLEPLKPHSFKRQHSNHHCSRTDLFTICK